ncbi:MAG: NAD(P)/FAD-dependent oxidoreductase [Burkholderiaceae bacterium]|jgi:FAD-dependent urate hydroxylase|nr:NAD(P)/FAD-dependent oxidoreductase [Burkholderiaceae bacterium]MDP4968790.1 NAD(P)/FAD-dependent oxidoreductase [Burkholderiaceae bacterium]
MQAHAKNGLDLLEARLRQDLSWLELPSKPWMIKKSHEGKPVIEVVIIGAGMAGLTAGTALSLLGIHPVLFDRAPEGYEGPWVTTARMETLRSPKQLTGPALGLPALTFRAWFEAQFGEQAWIDLDKIPRTQWMEYLRWYRKITRLEIRNEHLVLEVNPREDQLVELLVQHPKGIEKILARRVVIASGRDGLGGPSLPDFANKVPSQLRAHSSDSLDYHSLKGKRVGVIGAGASAMDSAATALECGAKSVDMLIRRADLPRINKGKGAGNPGLTHGHMDLPDEWKWRIRHYIQAQQVPPPRGSTLRVSKHGNARFNLGCPINDITVSAERSLTIHTPKGIFELDFLIFATGFKIDWLARPEYAVIAKHLRTWGNRYQHEVGLEDIELQDSPDLGANFDLREKIPGECPGLERIHVFCYPAALSHGTVSGDIPAISDGAKRLAQGIASLFYREDIADHFKNIQNFSEPEIMGDEWSASPPPQILTSIK